MSILIWECKIFLFNKKYLTFSYNYFHQPNFTDKETSLSQFITINSKRVLLLSSTDKSVTIDNTNRRLPETIKLYNSIKIVNQMAK